MAIAVFNYATWAAMYPDLATTVTEPAAQGYFNQACLILNNTDGSLVCDVNARLALLNMLTAHIAILASPARGGLVGRISNATEGSVTVAVAYSGPDQAQWFLQTAPGAQYWQSTAQYRTAVYAPAPPDCVDPYAGFGYVGGFGNPWNRGGL